MVKMALWTQFRCIKSLYWLGNVESHGSTGSDDKELATP